MSFWDVVLRLVFLIVFVILEVIAVSTVFQLLFSIPCVKLLNQKGEKGIRFLIPVYGGYLFFKKTADNGILYWFLALMMVLGSLSYQLSPIFAILFLVLIEFFHFVFSINLAASYDRKVPFAIGMLLLPLVFYFILAFSKAPAADSGSNAKQMIAGQTA